MKATRLLQIRSLLHQPARKKGIGSSVKVQVAQTIFDDPKGIPFNNNLFIRLSAFFKNPANDGRVAILERPNISEPDTVAYGYPTLATHLHYTRRRLVDRFLPVLRAPEKIAQKGQAIGLVADRSYEFVVNLFALLSIGLRPALISNAAKPREIQQLLDTAEASLLIVPDSLKDSGVYEDLPVYSSTEWSQKYKPFSHTQLQQEFRTVITKANQGTILFTSGTTGMPKAVFTNIASVSGQCSLLCHAWKYTDNDHILHALPLHHIHGLSNALLTPLTAGSTIEFVSGQFNADEILERIARPPSAEFPQVTMFHGVPTMYSAFIAAYDAMPAAKQEIIAEGLRRLRVAVCGSAALPAPIAQKWKNITGTIPLERYGMTETGMVLSNPINPEFRIPGSVGWPLENRGVYIVDANNRIIEFPGVPGELVVHWEKWICMFDKYWNNPSSTAESVMRPIRVNKNHIDSVKDGIVELKEKPKGVVLNYNYTLPKKFFRTGDVAMKGQNGEYYLLGRASVDIIKVAGHLVSTLEVEREILGLDDIAEAVVIGVPSERFGQLPYAIVVLKPAAAAEYNEDPKDHRKFVRGAMERLRKVLSAEKLPRKWIMVDKIPRNAMGKVNKKELLADRQLLQKADDSDAVAEIDNLSMPEGVADVKVS
ncbi:hypothetical protein Dda_1951 [Drechslerella dactyloides]|uniref:Acetyl-CoA synthetase-like protein n=1 Tax=Drechslerella dactyloides TaxID=74499 RepID=A0AAD6J2U7_DREDA|nr:hypothetical protein Dda_1951 [Drechslerella dactyloides]